MHLPNQKHHPCKVCASPTKFGDRLCQTHGPDLEWDNAVVAFYEATTRDGLCRICGERAPLGREIEEPFSIGDYIAHLPGCFFGRPLKAEDFNAGR